MLRKTHSVMKKKKKKVVGVVGSSFVYKSILYQFGFILSFSYAENTSELQCQRITMYNPAKPWILIFKAISNFHRVLT